MPAHRSLSGSGLLLLAVGLLVVAACTSDDDPTPAPDPTPTGTATPSTPSTPPLTDIGLAMSEASRSAVEPAAVASVADATNAFATDLYAALAAANGEDNLVFSPHSAAVALAMTLEGARGETAAEMAAVLHADLAGGELAAGFNGFDQALAAIPGEYPLGDETVELELATANQLFGQQGFAFEAEFLDTLASEYGAGMRLVDYETASEEARQLINAWVDEQTRTRIPELIPQGVINELTRLVLTNAIYLNAPWQHRFEEAATSNGTFTTLAGDEVTAPFMHETASYGYAAGAGYQAVELPYVGGQLSMVVVVPDAGEFASFEAGLDAARIAEVRDSLRGAQVALSFPRFEFRTQSALKPVLSDLGMPTAFTDRADFSGITSEASLLIQDVLHEAFISVDEEGTEAAAATAVVVGLTSAPAEPIELTVDRPFLFLIQERETGAVLFLGRVTDPTAN